jgi:competence protein ComEC
MGSVRAVLTDEPSVTDYGVKVTVRILPEDGNTALPAGLLQRFYMSMAAPWTPARQHGTVYSPVSPCRHDVRRGDAGLFCRRRFSPGAQPGSVEVTDRGAGLLYLPARIASGTADLLGLLFPTDAAAFMRALLLGDTAELGADPAAAPALKATGTWHIVSVSGMNIVFLVGLLGVFLRNKRLLTAVAVPVIFVFMAVVGFTPSVTRAGIMQFFVLAAPLVKRESDAVTALSASLLVILLANPFAAAAAGLQLSFTATLGILLFTGRLFESADGRLAKSLIYRYDTLKKAFRFLLGGMATTLGALVLTIPVTALHFGTVS